MTTKKREDNEGSVFYDAKKKSYIAVLTVGYNPETGRRIRKKRFGKTKREALEKLDELRQKYTASSFIEADKLTVSMWLDKWYKVYVEPRISESTKDSYMHKIDIAKRNIGSIRLSKLTATDLQMVIFGELKNKYRTAQYFRVLMKAAMKRAVRDHLIKDNPAECLELPPKPPKKKFAKPTKEAWEILLNAKTSYYYWRMLLLTEYMTGLRRSEILGLRWQDVEFRYDDSKQLTGTCIHIKHALIRGPKKENKRHDILLSKTKTEESTRDLMLPLSFSRELQAYRKEQLKIRLKALVWEDNDYIFCNTEGKAVNPNTFSSSFVRIRKRLGIASTFHMLRHDMACRMKQSKQFDMKDIQAQLGHSTIQVTMDIYTHIDDEDKNAVSCWLEGDAADFIHNPSEEKSSIKN